MKALFTKITLTVLVMLMATACSKDDNSQESISREQLHGRWAITALDGKLFVKVENIPETEAPLMPFWSGKIFYFQTNNNLSVLDKQTELFDFGTYTLSGNRLSVANYPGVLQINVSQNETMTLTNKQDDYYKMVAFYSGQSEAEIRQMYRVEGDIVFHLKKN